jgi:predicted GIY-YIG superfamily endonuclease
MEEVYRTHTLTVFPAKAGTQGYREIFEKRPCVYLLASRRNGTLYVGVIGDLARRVEGHRSGAVSGFTRKYGVYSQLDRGRDAARTADQEAAPRLEN